MLEMKLQLQDRRGKILNATLSQQNLRTRARYNYRQSQFTSQQKLTIVQGALDAPPRVDPNPQQPSLKDSDGRTLEVGLGERSYPIYIGTDLISKGELFSKHIRGKDVLIVTNTTVARFYLQPVKHALQNQQLQVHECILPDGEQYKDLEHVSKIWDAAMELRLGRKTTFVALGGGVVGDMTGYAAACFLRGVDFIQVPTTVMSQVDSSVGGKTGVNHPLGKNMIGAFYQPQAVLIDLNTLDTLPAREHASGITEILKYGLIKDPDFFLFTEYALAGLMHKDKAALLRCIETSCKIKALIVEEDERESGVRATLNLGHTFGHAIETWQGYGKWLHGEAVGCGICMAADLSHRLGWIEDEVRHRAILAVERCRAPTKAPAGMTPDDFKRLMAQDKKVEDGKIRLILLKGELGNCVITSDYDQEKLQETLEAYCTADAGSA